MNSKRFSIKARIESVQFAWNGLKTMILEEQNAQIHLLATAVVIIGGWIFELSREDWLAVIIAIAIVFTAELFNSAIEALCDHVTPDRHPGIKKIKDLAAAAVLVAATGALIIGILVFGPKIIDFTQP